MDVHGSCESWIVHMKLALSITEAAKAASIGKSTLYEILADGKGPRTFKVGTVQRVLVSDLQAWLEHAAKTGVIETKSLTM